MNGGKPWLAVINDPDSLGLSCNFEDRAVDLGGKYTFAGLPNFLPSLFNPAPNLSINKENEICEGKTTLKMTVFPSVSSSEVSYSWLRNGTMIQGANEPQHLVTAAGNYTAIAKVAQGPGQDSLVLRRQITILIPLPLRPVVDSLSHPTCDKDNGFIELSVQYGTSPFQFSINGEPYQGRSIFSFLRPGNHTISVIDSFECVSEIDVALTKIPSPSITDTEVSPSFCGHHNGRIVVEAQGVTGELQYTMDGLDFGEKKDFINLEAGGHIISVIDQYGCIKTLEVKIPIDNCPFYFPNAFTPNGDGHNDKFDVKSFNTGNISKYSLSIFNRWGKVVFKTSDPNIGWDGRSPQRMCQEGVYVYKVEASFSNGEIFNHNGTVTLFR